MAFAAPFLPIIGGVAGSVAAAAIGGRAPAPKVVTPRPAVTARTDSVAANELLRRRGSRANQRTGATGAESQQGAKKQFMGT